ncbi:MBL fold metallo-hydrolase [Parvularcula marina]|uniref:MBL fold metallo-hydrolase n=1 Tax=Parvularcula marina TaxID=2292771 RepID=UPI00351567E8
MVPFIRAFEFTHGEPDRLSPLITRVIAKNPGPFTFTGSGTYLIGDERGVAVIDPGPEDEAHAQAVIAATPGPITHILVTHTHLDHCGGTSRLKELTGAVVLGHGAHEVEKGSAPPALDEGADFNFRPDTEIRDGHLLELPSARLRAVHTPGHCANHLCFSLEEERALFTGDHIMGWATTVVAPPDGDMDDYFSSLDLLLARDDEVYYPTHGAPVPNPQEFVRAVRVHREKRDESILAAVTATPQSPLEIARIVYTDIDPAMHFAAALNVEAHLGRHVKRGSVRRHEDGGFSAG